MYPWTHTLNNRGINDPSVTANYPVYSVFTKGGIKTYLVYNYQSSPLTVGFSDGKKVVAKPNALTLERNQ